MVNKKKTRKRRKKYESLESVTLHRCKLWSIQCVLCIYAAFIIVLLRKYRKKCFWAAVATEKRQTANRMNTFHGRRIVVYFFPHAFYMVNRPLFGVSTKAALKSKRLIIFGCFSRPFISFISGQTCRKHNSGFFCVIVCCCCWGCKTPFNCTCFFLAIIMSNRVMFVM